MRQAVLTALISSAAIAGGCDREIVADDAEMPPPSVVIANDQRAAEVVGPDVEAAEGALIPALLHGRWGLTVADCSSGGAGHLVVTADALRFNDLVARPVADIDATADSFSAVFSFVGEAMKQSRFQSLELQDGKLIRTVRNPAAAFSYVRCD